MLHIEGMDLIHEWWVESGTKPTIHVDALILHVQTAFWESFETGEYGPTLSSEAWPQSWCR